MDHIEPLAGGGQSEEHNMVPACPSCNTTKSDTPLLAFLAGVKPPFGARVQTSNQP